MLWRLHILILGVHRVTWQNLVIESDADIVDLSSDNHVSSSYLASLGWRHHLLVHTTQVVVSADVADNFKTASVKLAISEIVANLGFALDEQG